MAIPGPIMLALPHGGVEVGFMVSGHLQIPLEVFLTRKLGFPGNSEYSMGAMAETGLTWLNTDAQEWDLEQDARFNSRILPNHPRTNSKARFGRDMTFFSSYPRFLSVVRQHSPLEIFRHKVSK